MSGRRRTESRIPNPIPRPMNSTRHQPSQPCPLPAISHHHLLMRRRHRLQAPSLTRRWTCRSGAVNCGSLLPPCGGAQPAAGGAEQERALPALRTAGSRLPTATAAAGCRSPRASPPPRSDAFPSPSASQGGSPSRSLLSKPSSPTRSPWSLSRSPTAWRPSSSSPPASSSYLEHPC